MRVKDGAGDFSRVFPNGVGVYIALLCDVRMLPALVPEKMLEALRSQPTLRLIPCPCVGEVGSMSDDVRRAWEGQGVVPSSIEVSLLLYNGGFHDADELLVLIESVARHRENCVVVVVALERAELHQTRGLCALNHMGCRPFYQDSVSSSSEGGSVPRFRRVAVIEGAVSLDGHMFSHSSLDDMTSFEELTLDGIRTVLEELPRHIVRAAARSHEESRGLPSA